MIIKSVRVDPSVAGDESQDLVDHMVKQPVGIYDPLIAARLVQASTWAYADIDTFARMMAIQGGVPENETVLIRNTNPEILADTTAYLVQSKDRRLAILCFRGTSILNIVNHLTDITAELETFSGSGKVHGGFLRAGAVMVQPIRKLLLAALKGGSIGVAACRLKAQVRNTMEEAWWRAETPCGGEHGEGRGEDSGPNVEAHLPPAPRLTDKNKLEALYITGHSLASKARSSRTSTARRTPRPDTTCRRARGFPWRYPSRTRGTVTWSGPPRSFALAMSRSAASSRSW